MLAADERGQQRSCEPGAERGLEPLSGARTLAAPLALVEKREVEQEEQIASHRERSIGRSADEVHRRQGDDDREGKPEEHLVVAVAAEPLRVEGRERPRDVDAEVDGVVDPVGAQLHRRVRIVLILGTLRYQAMARRNKGSAQEAGRAERALARAGVQPTRQRVAIAAELMDEHDDVTAQELHARLRARGVPLGLATVYRTLGLLAEGGAIDTLSHHAGELCYRWCGDDHHHHLVCSSCHRVVELAECELDPWLDRLSAAHGFVATGHRLEVAGLCASCR